MRAARLQATAGVEPGIGVLQTPALPLGSVAPSFSPSPSLMLGTITTSMFASHVYFPRSHGALAPCIYRAAARSVACAGNARCVGGIEASRLGSGWLSPPSTPRFRRPLAAAAHVVARASRETKPAASAGYTIRSHGPLGPCIVPGV